MTTCKNCYTNGNCQTCPERSRIITEFEIEQDNAEKALDHLPCWIAGLFFVVAAVGLIVGTVCYL